MAVQSARENTPKGNWVARNFRLSSFNTDDLFPKTPAEFKAKKFHSTYRVNFHEFPIEIVLEGLAPKGQQPMRETIRDVLFGDSPTSVRSPSPVHHVPPGKACLLSPQPEQQLFAKWKIPRHISDECEEIRKLVSPPFVVGDHLGVVPQDGKETPRILRQSTLPAIYVRQTPKEFIPKPPLSAKYLRRAHTMDLPSTHSKQVGQSWKSRASEWKEKLPDVDHRLLEKVARLQDWEVRGRVSLLPNARRMRTVERWVETASELERQLALQFFSSKAGGLLLGNEGEAQNIRLKEVIAALQSGPSNRWLCENGLSPRGGVDSCLEDDDQGKKLKYIHLLDQGARSQRFMHTTWHHLPTFSRHKPVNNWSSHFLRPHQPQHRHFVIHPDWAPE